MSENTAAKPLQSVSSNGWPMPLTPRYLKPIAAIEAPLTRIAEMRRALEEDGFALLRGLLPGARVQAAREAYESLERRGATRPGASYGTNGHFAHAFVRDAAFRALCAAPELAALGDALFEAPSRLLRRRPFRHYAIGSGRATRAHRDWSYLDLGTREVVTIWLPLLPCDVFTGALIYLEKSRDLDIASLRERMRGHTDRPDAHQIVTNDLKGLADVTNTAWRYPRMQPGDVLLHDPFIIHASLDCCGQSRRLSTDLRLIRAGEAADPRWDADWAADDGY